MACLQSKEQGLGRGSVQDGRGTEGFLSRRLEDTQLQECRRKTSNPIITGVL